MKRNGKDYHKRVVEPCKVTGTAAVAAAEAVGAAAEDNRAYWVAYRASASAFGHEYTCAFVAPCASAFPFPLPLTDMSNTE